MGECKKIIKDNQHGFDLVVKKEDIVSLRGYGFNPIHVGHPLTNYFPKSLLDIQLPNVAGSSGLSHEISRDMCKLAQTLTYIKKKSTKDNITRVFTTI